jgi:hypothetical protein
VTARDDVQPLDPKSEPTRGQVNARDPTLGEFMERTRRYFRLTHRTRKLHYARGLDSSPEDFA